MDNLHKSTLSIAITHFAYEVMFENDSDDDDGDNDKIVNFCEEIVPEMNHKQFKTHFRLSVNVFETLLQNLHSLYKNENAVRVGHPETSLDKACMIVIWYLANLESLRSVANRFGGSKSTCWAVLCNTCELLLKLNMQHHIIKWSSTSTAETIRTKFQRRYGMSEELRQEIDVNNPEVEQEERHQDNDARIKRRDIVNSLHIVTFLIRV